MPSGDRDDPEDEARRQDWDLVPARDLDLGVQDRLRSLERERGLLDTIGGTCWWSAVRIYMSLFHRMRVVGRENVPLRPPFLIAANHTSHLDVMVLGALLPRRVRHCVYPIAAGDVFFESVLTAGFAAFVLNALPMWRRRAGSHALQQLRNRLLAEPCGYILFPEGTRSRNGEMSSFKGGLGKLVAGSEVSVIPCHIRGAFRALPPGSRIPRPRRVLVTVGTARTFADSADDRVGWQAVARAVEDAVRELAEMSGS